MINLITNHQQHFYSGLAILHRFVIKKPTALKQWLISSYICMYHFFFYRSLLGWKWRNVAFKAIRDFVKSVTRILRSLNVLEYQQIIMVIILLLCRKRFMAKFYTNITIGMEGYIESSAQYNVWSQIDSFVGTFTEIYIMETFR